MKTTLSLSIGVLLFCHAHAQEFSGAFVVPVGLDTVRGLVLNETDDILGYGIQFKQDADGGMRTYFPRELSSFGFNNGREFRSQLIGDDPADSTAFLVKKVLDGKLTVYLWRKSSSEPPEFFVENNYSGRKVHLTKLERTAQGRKQNQKVTRNATVYQGFLSFVKGDSLHSYPAKKKIGYNEKNILEDIAAYNQMFREEYTPWRYKEETNTRFAIAAGLPLSTVKASGFRMSVFRSIEFPEKKRRVSYLSGISYRYWQKKPSFETRIQLPEHVISILPVGLDLHSAYGAVRLFLAVSFGAFVSIDTDFVTIEGTRTKLRFSPTGNIGTGIRVKTGSDFLALEVTPSRNQLFLNLGYVF